MMCEYLSIDKLRFTYPQAKTPALQNISFSVPQGAFVTICGSTGSGKTTLLRLLKPELSPLGETQGQIHLRDIPQEKWTLKQSTAIGYVMQKPEQQIVTDTVWHELAFGLENLHLSQQTIAARIAETATYFGMTALFDQRTDTLSGGQKQLLNLAGVMAMRPEILILDEPTAQLDPIAASEFLAMLERLHRDLSLTILISEHCLEEILPLSTHMLILESGSLLAYDTPKNAVKAINKVQTEKLMHIMPTAARFSALLGNTTEDIPLSIAEGHCLTERYQNTIKKPPERLLPSCEKAVLEMKHVSYRYDSHAQDVLHDVNLTVHEGEIVALLGSNAAGKTTLLETAAKLHKPRSGKIRVFRKKLNVIPDTVLYHNGLALLPQDVQTIFLRDTVEEELSGGEAPFDWDWKKYDSQHPYDLSGGEQQMLALAKVLQCHPKLLLLDEPTKGMDADLKVMLAGVLQELRRSGVAILFTTHDTDFAACADRCSLCFRGQIVCCMETAAFMNENQFYTTSASRMTKGLYENVVTVEEAVALCQQNGLKNYVHL
ncbi:MAG: ATP-binding cassette domain-containing protein [Ruminococcus sp.]|nr:ATP-binding cassette domain-containing protein [Ruminococcus sp.]